MNSGSNVMSPIRKGRPLSHPTETRFDEVIEPATQPVKEACDVEGECRENDPKISYHTWPMRDDLRRHLGPPQISTRVIIIIKFHTTRQTHHYRNDTIRWGRTHRKGQIGKLAMATARRQVRGGAVQLPRLPGTRVPATKALVREEGWSVVCGFTLVEG